MKTKIVYCLVSNDKDYYYEQLLISLCSLRKHNPDIWVEIFCDEDTFESLKDNRCGIFNYNVKVNPVKVPKDWRQIERSRYIKLNLRKLVQGDFLYIDVDTVICSSLECLDDIRFEIAAVRDSHVERVLPKRTKCLHKTEHWIWGEAIKAGKNIEGLAHFNGGVIYAKDAPKAYELYAKWYENYLAQLPSGVKIDQLPLLLANHELGNVISPLPSDLDCQVSFENGRKMLPKARIIHYFPTQGKTLLSSSWILDPIKETGRINASIQRIIDEPDNFFIKLSSVVVGNAASLVLTPSLLEFYNSCPNVFCLFVKLLRVYLAVKKMAYRVVHRK